MNPQYAQQTQGMPQGFSGYPPNGQMPPNQYPPHNGFTGHAQGSPNHGSNMPQMTPNLQNQMPPMGQKPNQGQNVNNMYTMPQTQNVGPPQKTQAPQIQNAQGSNFQTQNPFPPPLSPSNSFPQAQTQNSIQFQSNQTPQSPPNSFPQTQTQNSNQFPSNQTPQSPPNSFPQTQKQNPNSFPSSQTPQSPPNSFSQAQTQNVNQYPPNPTSQSPNSFPQAQKQNPNPFPPNQNQPNSFPQAQTQNPNQFPPNQNQPNSFPQARMQNPNTFTQSQNHPAQNTQNIFPPTQNAQNAFPQAQNTVPHVQNPMPPMPKAMSQPPKTPAQNPMSLNTMPPQPMMPQPNQNQPMMPMQRPNYPPQPNQLSNQMANMNLNGPPRPPSQMPLKNQSQYPNQGYPMINGGPGINGMQDPNSPRGNIPPQTGFPPMTNQQGYPGVYPQQGYPPQQAPFPAAQPSYPQQQQPQKRLDPDLMPSPMQVMEEDQKNKSGIFYTNQKGQVPPLVTTDFIVQDQGNASPRFIRSTMYNVPVTSDLMKQTGVPFGLIISPMAEVTEEEQPPPLVDFGEIGPVRCVRCKAYMCPNMQFFDGGRRFHCLLCTASTEVPGEYFQHLDHTGLRVDRFERAELVLGTYDIIATKEYCRDNQPPKPPALIFLIDVSYNNVKSGLVNLLCSQMKTFLQSLPKERDQVKSSMKVGFITYNSSVHFYNINPNLGQPQMLLVGDTQEMFMPLLDGFLADAEESEALIDTLMKQIPAMFADTKETETILAPAIQAGLEALKASNCSGKLIVFHSSLPTCEAPGKLKNRDDRKLLGTEKEKTVLTPQNTVYNNLGQECVAAGCSVDLFALNNSYIDLATIGQVARLTGGEIYKYTYFQADLDGERLVSDVEKNIKRLCAFDAIMRVRTSTGVRPTDFYGHFYMSNTTDIELAGIDPDKAVAIEIKHDDKLADDSTIYIQAALLYTSLTGQRRIRIINLSLKSCSQMSDLYRACELDTVVNFLSKQSIIKILDSSPKAIKESLITQSAQILACYRKNCASPTPAGQLILPECMKLLPVYMNSVLKSDPLSGGSDMTVDDRWFTMAAVLIMDIPSSLLYYYPRLLPLHDINDDEFPICIRCSADKMSENGVYLLENGIYMFLWLGLAVSSDWVMSVFGVPSTAQVDTDKNRLPELNNPLSEKVRGLIATINNSRHRTMRLTIVRQGDKMELVMKHFLVEDKGLDNSSSYVDFLCHLHKEIRSQVS